LPIIPRGSERKKDLKEHLFKGEFYTFIHNPCNTPLNYQVNVGNSFFKAKNRKAEKLMKRPFFPFQVYYLEVNFSEEGF
jgi:hypothetical protein